MIRDWKQWQGQIVNGTFPLRQYLGGSEHSAVFMTERRGREPQRAVIKLIPANPATAGVQLSRWEATAKLSHPHLLRLFESGSCQLDQVVLLFVVMEYAEDNLSQILPQRALTPAEVRELLEPALEALTFIHGKSLVHSRLKPSNVLAAKDQLKLSSDSLLRSGEAAGIIAAPSEYDAPEIANGNILPGSDIWSLGMTIMEALTQRLPACKGIAEPLPETVPAPFMGIAHCCLRLDPQRRCAAADIAARLQSGPSVSPQPSTVRIPAASAKSRYLLLIAVVILAVGAVVIGPKLLTRRPAQSAAPVSSTPPSSEPAAPHSAQSAPPETEPAPKAIEAKPSAIRPRNDRQVSKAAAPSVFPAAAPSVPAAASIGRGGVLQQVTPAVSRSAQNTITGTIRVRVKVLVDSSGNVENAALITAGPSKYFASKAVGAAQQWKFAPGAPGPWILHFGFKRSGTELDSEPAKP
ncbi:MAG: serine/threonine protein kinase [Terriglobales bacterium]